MGSANSAGIAGFPESRLPETISPELVLVDPELRSRVLAGLLQADALDALAARSHRLPSPPRRATDEQLRRPTAGRPAAAAVRQRRASRWPRALRTPAVVPGLVALSIFVALGVSEARVSEPTLGPAPTASNPGASSSAAPSKPSSAHPRPVKRPVARKNAVARQSSAAVERDVLSRILTSPAGKIPRALIDSRTGLAKNNLQASCRRSTAPGTFVCEVRPAAHEAREGSTVRYRQMPQGPAEISWGSYRGH
jgi:hypothetical protein